MHSCLKLDLSHSVCVSLLSFTSVWSPRVADFQPREHTYLEEVLLIQVCVTTLLGVEASFKG